MESTDVLLTPICTPMMIHAPSYKDPTDHTSANEGKWCATVMGAGRMRARTTMMGAREGVQRNGSTTKGLALFLGYGVTETRGDIYELKAPGVTKDMEQPGREYLICAPGVLRSGLFCSGARSIPWGRGWEGYVYQRLYSLLVEFVWRQSLRCSKWVWRYSNDK